MGQQLKELGQKEKIRGQKVLDFVIIVLPIICGLIAIIGYWEVPNGSLNSHPYTYAQIVAAFTTAYALYALETGTKNRRGDRQTVEDLCYCAPSVPASFLLLIVHDHLTLKTGILSQPFAPCVNSILNIAWEDRAYLFECTLHTLRLLFLGYSIGIVLELVTEITCGYSERAQCWIDSIIKFLGSIPAVAWIPIIMTMATSLFRGAVLIIALGSWFVVTVVSISGIQNVGKDFFEAARTLGASERQLVFQVVIPYVMPSILQDYTQAVSSSCVTIMTAEMMGVKAGLGWYMDRAKSQMTYDKMFAALFIICFIFIIVIKVLDLTKRHVLR